MEKNLHEALVTKNFRTPATTALILMVLATLTVAALVYFAPAPVFDDFDERNHYGAGLSQQELF